MDSFSATQHCSAHYRTDPTSLFLYGPVRRACGCHLVVQISWGWQVAQPAAHGRLRSTVCVSAPRHTLNQAAEVFHEEGCRVVLGSVLKEQEEPFSRWLCEELERQNPKEFQQILEAEQKLSECTVKADESAERREAMDTVAWHHHICFGVYCKGYPNVEETVFDKIKIAGMTMAAFMRIFAGRGAENKVFRRRQILAVFDEAQDYHLFQALGMASLVDAAIFLQDKQQTFQQTDDGIIDHQYWAKLFDTHSQIVDVPAMTIQTTSKIVEPVDEQSMLTTYRMGRMALDGCHMICCSGKDCDEKNVLHTAGDPHHTTCTLVVVNSDNDGGTLPQKSLQPPHCQDRVMPSYRYFAVMAGIALHFLKSFIECAILACYKLQKEFVLPLLVKMIASLAKERNLASLCFPQALQEKLCFLESRSTPDFADKLREVTWACGRDNISDCEKIVVGQTAHHTARAAKGFTCKGVIALLTKRAQSDEYPLGIAFSSKGVRTALMTRASQALVVVVDDWIMRQDNATSCKYNAREPDDSSNRCNWKVLQLEWSWGHFLLQQMHSGARVLQTPANIRSQAASEATMSGIGRFATHLDVCSDWRSAIFSAVQRRSVISMLLFQIFASLESPRKRKATKRST